MTSNDEQENKITYLDCKDARFHIRSASCSDLSPVLHKAHDVAKSTGAPADVYIDVKGQVKGEHLFCTVYPKGEIIEADRGKKSSIYEKGTLEINIEMAGYDER